MYFISFVKTHLILLQIPTNTAGLIEYRAHPFWAQKYCPKHEHDRTSRCCSCERMEVISIAWTTFFMCVCVREVFSGLMFFFLLSYVATRHKICCPWWWPQPLPRVSGFCNNGYWPVSTSISWYTRILWKFKYEGGTASAVALGWETSS